jgi:hypothetical protein
LPKTNIYFYVGFKRFCALLQGEFSFEKQTITSQPIEGSGALSKRLIEISFPDPKTRNGSASMKDQGIILEQESR